jgi:hypothetical protein
MYNKRANNNNNPSRKVHHNGFQEALLCRIPFLVLFIFRSAFYSRSLIMLRLIQNEAESCSVPSGNSAGMNCSQPIPVVRMMRMVMTRDVYIVSKIIALNNHSIINL